MSRVYISAAHKSSGKTTVSIGLCAALTHDGAQVQTYKKGPDYIDPHWLARATGRDCYNLDFYTMSDDEMLRCISEKSRDADISLIEGNKGLYDGLALDGSNSNAALATLTDTPVILVLDARGITRGIAPLILGYQAFDPDIRIEGIILNQLGGSRHESKLRNVIEHYTDAQVVGAIHRDAAFDIDERHLGLMPSHEDPFAEDKIEKLAHAIRKQVDLDLVRQIASGAGEIECDRPVEQLAVEKDIRLGVVRSPAFGFYYADDLEALDSGGAEIIEIDVINDADLPDVDALFIGGGFPETHLQELASNTTMRSQIREAIDTGMPVYAECGGLMYLSRSISWNGETHEMVGAIPGDIEMHDKPQGRGYVQVMHTTEHPWSTGAGATIHAHEFHYSRFKALDKDARFAFDVERGTGIDGEHDGYVRNNLLACYTHQRNTDENPWTDSFLAFIRQNRNTNGERR